MNLSCQGVRLLSAGEFIELTRGLRHDVVSSTLTAMTLGAETWTRSRRPC